MLRIESFDISTVSDKEFLQMYAASDKSRKLKADRLKQEPAKKLSLAAGMLARQGIAKHFGINPKDIKFRCDQNGKPYAEGLDIHFSLSHSGDLAVCAISDTPVGIDVEKVRHVNTGVAKKWFTEQEQAFVFSDKTKAQRRFFEIWTKKEAYAKRTGAGIPAFKKFSVIGDSSVYLIRDDTYIVAVSVVNKA